MLDLVMFENVLGEIACRGYGKIQILIILFIFVIQATSLVV